MCVLPTRTARGRRPRVEAHCREPRSQTERELNTIRVPRGGDEVLTFGNQGIGNASKAMGTDETLGTVRGYGNSRNSPGTRLEVGGSSGTHREHAENVVGTWERI